MSRMLHNLQWAKFGFTVKEARWFYNEYMNKLDRYATVSHKLRWYTKAKPFKPAYMGTTETDSGYFYCPHIPNMKLIKVKNK